TDSASKEYVDNVFKNVKVTGGGQEFTVSNGDTSTQKITVNTDAGKKHFDIKGKDGVTTTVVGRAVEVGLTTETKNKINKIDNLETKVNNQGITFKGNTGQTNSIKLGDTLKVEGVTGETEVMASTDKLALGLAKKVKDEIASKMSSFKIKANSEANEETISNDNTIVFKNGKNINVTRSNKELIFATVATPEFTSVQYGNSGPKITSTGGNLKVTGADGNTPVKITNVAEGTEKNDAVNKGQLDNATVTYFHTNTGEQNQGNGDENTNKGKITDKAGAKGKHSITAGVNAKAEGENSIAIGYEAKISAQNAVAIGANSKAGSHSAAYGYNAQALGERSVAVGENAMINDRAARATALGNNTVVTVGGGVALGYGSNASTAGGVEGLKQAYSVTTGGSTVENGFKSTGSVDNNSIPIGAVSVGNDKIKRQIVNVAAGTQDTDAVNVAQLKSLTMKIEGNENKHNGANADLNSADRPKVGLWSDTLKVLGTDGEIKTSASGNTITLKVDETVKNKITNLDSKVTKLDKDGLMVKTSTAPDAKTIEVSKDGIKAGDKKITNVAEGTISGTSTDAVTGKQLHNFITANNNVVNNSGSVNFADGNHTKIDTQTTGTIKVNVTTGAFVNPTTDGKLSQQTAGVATIENVSAAVNAGYWTAKVNGNTEVAKIKFGDTLDFVDGNVTTARMSEAGKVTFDVKVDDSSIKIVNGKLVSTLKAPETTTLTVSEANDNTKGKVTDVAEGDKNKFVTADNIATTLNKIGFNVESGGNLATGNADGKQLIKAGDTVTFKAGYGLTVKREGNNFTYALGSTLTTDKFTAGEKGENGKEGKDGTIGVNGKDGSSVVINGKDGSIGLNGTNGENGVTIKGGQGSAGVDGADGTTKTRIVYEYKDPNTNEMVTEKIATLNDGQKYSGDNYAENKAETVIKKKLNERLEIKGGATEVSTNNNIGVIAENGVLNVRLAKNIDLGADGSVTTGNTKVDNNGITIKKPANAGDGKSDVKLTANGLDNGGNKIINVAAGVADTDAVNVSQLNTKAAASKTEVKSTDKSVGVTASKGDKDQTIYDLSVVKSKLKAAEDKRTVTAETKGNAFVTGEEVANAINTTTAAARTEVEAGKNVKVTSKTGANGQNIYNVSVSGDLSDITSISNGDTKVSLGKDKQGNPVVNMNGARITNVGDGSAEGDIVNVRQLNKVVSSVNTGFNQLSRDIGRVDVNARAGIASAVAMANLPQISLPGKSAISVSNAQYRGQSAYAIGYSKISDNGKWLIRASVSSNTQRDTAIGGGVGFVW
ncbi:YadA-like family protein, partial [Glaesserella parasuis]|nr:YadA-like family protein [Glaesserella parasuis]